jgi:hypothetical protein
MRRGYISEFDARPGTEYCRPATNRSANPDLVCMPVPAAAEQTMPAEALIDFLAAPAAAPVYKPNGMEPG